MSSQASNREVFEQSIEEVRNDLVAQAESLTTQAERLTAHAESLTAHAQRLTAQVAAVDTLAVQITNRQAEAQPAQSEQSSIDCMNQFAILFNQRMDKTDQRFAEMHTRMLATEFNNIARVQNSHLENHKDGLAAFHNTTTNEPIAHFPGTVEDLYAMDAAEINSLLRELGGPPAFGIPDGQEKLRKFLGLKHIVVWQTMRVQGFS